ncbi:hypothetical protein [Dipodfec virus UOA04_Rod_1030]|nr:hypothetical protein [Dipodfec virus UOA04_Rod_1030]
MKSYAIDNRVHAAPASIQFGVVPLLFRQFSEHLGEVCGLPLSEARISYQKPFYLVDLYTSFDGTGITRPSHLVLSLTFSDNGKFISFRSFKKTKTLGF